MGKEDKITVEASGEFPFKFFIEKAIATNDVNEMILEGIASTTNLDHDSERMSESALRAMEAAINETGVPLRVEHAKEDEAIIGKVYEARVDERNQLHVKARLDPKHIVSKVLYDSMKQGSKMGLSVGGFVRRAIRELNEKTGKMVKTFYDVALKEVSVTPRPANFDSWIVAKSFGGSDDGERLRGTAVYQEFLSENPQLDYLQSFAKSIPDGAWRKVASQDNNTMETKKTSEDKEGDTEKAVSRAEFSTAMKAVAKGFDSMNALLSKALHIDAMDQNAPNKVKPEEIGDEVHASKAEGAMDQVNPDKAKPEDVGDKAKKTTADGTDENGTREKTSDKDETKEKSEAETETKEKAETDTETKEKATKKKDTTDEYDLQTVERATKSMDSLLTRLNKAEEETETKEKMTETEMEADAKKATKEDDKEDEATKGMHPLDAFVFKVGQVMSAMVTKMEKSGKTVPGFEKHLLNTIREDATLQEEIAGLIKVPGFKKSLVMGTPYVKSKDGRMFSLTMNEAGPTTLEKSQKEGAEKKTFKEVFKTQFSSIKDENA